jgi:alpha-1,2-mannosyltransferase
VPEWLFDLINPWTTPATLLVGVASVAWLVGVRGRRLATVAAVTAAGLGLWQAWKIGPPSGLLDLQIYVGSARGWLEGGSLYDFRDGVHHLGATYPPIGPIPFGLLAPLPVELREIVWTALSLGVLATATWFTAEIAGVERERRTTWCLWAFAAAVVTIPVWLTLRQGQVNAVLWCLIVVDVAAVGRRSRWSGVGIGLATAIKLVPGLFVVWLLLAGRRASAGRAVLAAAAATALGWALAPSDSRRYWTDLIFDSGRVGEVDDGRNNSVLSVVARLVEPGPGRTGLWLGLAVVVVAVGLWRGVAATRSDDLLTATAVVGCAAMLVSPISWTHHLGFVLLALVAFSTRRPTPAAVAALVVAWVALLDPGSLGDDAAMSALRTAAMVAVVVFLPIVPGRSATGRPASQERSVSGGDDAEHPVDELATPGLEVVAPDRHAPEHVGPALAHDVGELVDGLARVEGEGAEDGAALPGEERQL